jgi:predicted HTH transcriptional regulator
MNAVLLEELLNEEESSTLDFKRDQYPFSSATNDQKSELLKDILAFANAWRRTDAFILTGVEEVKGSRSIVRGITSSIDDASIQQFVNSKTNRPITFSYEVFSFEGTQVGVLHVPLQDRPIYLKNDFGKLKKDVVYIRRGSSTDTADPDEIAKMGTLKIREVIADLPVQHKSNPVIEALRSEMEKGNVILVEKVNHKFDKPRYQCKIIEVNELYATFSNEKYPDQGISGSISQITVSYEPMMKMTMFTIAPIG